MKFCISLQGGSSWWKYEFCYGRHVMQFHKEVGQHGEHFYRVNILQDTKKLLGISSSFFCLFVCLFVFVRIMNPG